MFKVARLCLGLKFEKHVLFNGCRSLTVLKPLQSCDFALKACPRTSVTPVFLLTKEESHERKTSRFVNIFTAVCAATAFTCVFLSNSVVHAAWEESQGKLTEMRLKRKRNGFLTVGRVNLFSRLISPNLAVQSTFKFSLFTESNKTET